MIDYFAIPFDRLVNANHRIISADDIPVEAEYARKLLREIKKAATKMLGREPHIYVENHKEMYRIFIELPEITIGRQRVGNLRWALQIYKALHPPLDNDTTFSEIWDDPMFREQFISWGELDYAQYHPHAGRSGVICTDLNPYIGNYLIDGLYEVAYADVIEAATIATRGVVDELPEYGKCEICDREWDHFCAQCDSPICTKHSTNCTSCESRLCPTCKEYYYFDTETGEFLGPRESIESTLPSRAGASTKEFLVCRYCFTSGGPYWDEVNKTPAKSVRSCSACSRNANLRHLNRCDVHFLFSNWSHFICNECSGGDMRIIRDAYFTYSSHVTSCDSCYNKLLPWLECIRCHVPLTNRNSITDYRGKYGKKRTCYRCTQIVKEIKRNKEKTK